MGFSHKVLLQDFTGIFDDATDNKIPELRDRCKMISTTAHLSPSRKSERRVFHPEDFFE